MLSCCCCSIAKLCSTLQSHGLQHTRLACRPLSPGVCSSSCPLSRLCYLTISSSAAFFSFCLQSFPASGSFPMSQVFSNELAFCIRWPKYWSFSFSISPSSEYSRLISFRIDLINLFAVQGTLKSLFQHLSSIKPKQFLQSLLQLEKCVHPLTFGNSPFPKLVNL